MKVTKTQILALTNINLIRKDEKGYLTFSRKITYDMMEKLRSNGYVTPYEGSEFGKPVTKFKLTELGKSILA